MGEDGVHVVKAESVLARNIQNIVSCRQISRICRVKRFLLINLSVKWAPTRSMVANMSRLLSRATGLPGALTAPPAFKLPVGSKVIIRNMIGLDSLWEGRNCPRLERGKKPL